MAMVNGLGQMTSGTPPKTHQYQKKNLHVFIDCLVARNLFRMHVSRHMHCINEGINECMKCDSFYVDRCIHRHRRHLPLLLHLHLSIHFIFICILRLPLLSSSSSPAISSSSSCSSSFFFSSSASSSSFRCWVKSHPDCLCLLFIF